jgi:hypothetical protein
MKVFCIALIVLALCYQSYGAPSDNAAKELLELFKQIPDDMSPNANYENDAKVLRALVKAASQEGGDNMEWWHVVRKVARHLLGK